MLVFAMQYIVCDSCKEWGAMLVGDSLCRRQGRILLADSSFLFVINCQFDGVSLGGGENFEQSKVVRICLMANSHIKEFLLPAPYDPTLFKRCLGALPLRTPSIVPLFFFALTKKKRSEPCKEKVKTVMLWYECKCYIEGRKTAGFDFSKR